MSAASKRQRLGYSSIPKAKITALRDLCVATIVSGDFAFSHFDKPYLKRVLQYHSLEVYSQVPWSRTSVMERFDFLFSQGQARLTTELRNAVSKIHLSFDLWTSPNNYAFMAVSGHFLDAEGIQQSRLLGFPQQRGRHHGENLSNTLITVVSNYQIEGSIGVTVSDNASSNDTCLNAFYPRIEASMTGSDVTARRMRCYGHILNLVARAFLFGADLETFEAESEFYQEVGRHEEDLRMWRKLGAVGRLRNIVLFVRASPQRSERYRRAAAEIDGAAGFHLFAETSAEARLILNNETRWNSIYLMIQRALEKKAEVQAFLMSCEDEDDVNHRIPDADILSGDDWKVLAEIKHVLEPFYLQPKRTEGWGLGDGHGRLWEVMMGMEYLLDHLVDWRDYYRSEIHHPIDLTAPDDSQQSHSYSQRRSARGNQPQGRRFNINTIPAHVRADWAAFGARQTSRFNTLDERYQRHLRTSLEMAWGKLWEYYSRLGDSPLFAASIILHPSLGYSYLEDVWSAEHQLIWLRNAKEGITDYFNKWYRRPSEEVEVEPAAPAQLGILPDVVTASAHEDSHFRQWINSRRRQAPPRADELELYLRQRPETGLDPIRWWIEHRETYPILSKLALDILAIPAMAADCERAFSSAGLTLSSQRLSMRPQTVERIQLIKNWLKRGVLMGKGDLGFMGIV
ncbi:transposase-like protein [Colletotrichum incanum]|uniref:Transposase-like protein n=1 Tax=Colletotrichum incanum TaxID=1573173 RepID=A0A161W5A3_COLIC|nr:transposase-like protein [Colletotrichum incanum]